MSGTASDSSFPRVRLSGPSSLSVASLLSESAEQLRELRLCRDRCATECAARLSAEERISATEHERNTWRSAYDEKDAALCAMTAENARLREDVALWMRHCAALRNPEHLLEETEPIVRETAHVLQERLEALREERCVWERDCVYVKHSAEGAVRSACIGLAALRRRGEEMRSSAYKEEKEWNDVHRPLPLHPPAPPAAPAAAACSSSSSVLFPSYDTHSSCEAVSVERRGASGDDFAARLASHIAPLEEQWTAAVSHVTYLHRRLAAQQEELHSLRTQRDAAVEAQYIAQETAQSTGDQLKALHVQYRSVLRGLRQQCRVLAAGAIAQMGGKVRTALMRARGTGKRNKKSHFDDDGTEWMETDEDNKVQSEVCPINEEEEEKEEKEEERMEEKEKEIEIKEDAKANSEKNIPFRALNASCQQKKDISQYLALPAHTALHQRALRSLLQLSRNYATRTVLSLRDAARASQALSTQLRDTKLSHSVRIAQLRLQHTQKESALQAKLTQTTETETQLLDELSQCTRRATAAERALDAMGREVRHMRRALNDAQSATDETRTALAQRDALARENAFDIRALRERCDGLVAMAEALEAHADRSHSQCESLYNVICALMAIIACIAVRATRARAERQAMTNIYFALDTEVRACRDMLCEFTAELCDARHSNDTIHNSDDDHDENPYDAGLMGNIQRRRRCSFVSVGLAVKASVRLLRIGAKRRRAADQISPQSFGPQFRRRVVFAMDNVSETSVRRVAAPFLYGTEWSLPIVRLPPLQVFLRAMANAAPNLSTLEKSHQNNKNNNNNNNNNNINNSNNDNSGQDVPLRNNKERDHVMVQGMERCVSGAQSVMQWLSLADLDTAAPATCLSIGSEFTFVQPRRHSTFSSRPSVTTESRRSFTHTLRDVLMCVQRKLRRARAQLHHQSTSIAQSAAEAQRFASERAVALQTQTELRDALDEAKAASSSAVREAQSAAQQRVLYMQEEWEKERCARRDAETTLQALRVKEVELTRALRAAQDEIRSLSFELAAAAPEATRTTRTTTGAITRATTGATTRATTGAPSAAMSLIGGREYYAKRLGANSVRSTCREADGLYVPQSVPWQALERIKGGLSPPSTVRTRRHVESDTSTVTVKSVYTNESTTSVRDDGNAEELWRIIADLGVTTQRNRFAK